MAHETRVIKSERVANAGIAITVRCCGDEASDSVHTTYNLASEESIRLEIEAHKQRVADFHESVLRAEQIAAKLIEEDASPTAVEEPQA